MRRALPANSRRIDQKTTLLPEARRVKPRITRMGTDRIWDFNLLSVVIRVIRGPSFCHDRTVASFSASD